MKGIIMPTIDGKTSFQENGRITITAIMNNGITKPIEGETVIPIPQKRNALKTFFLISSCLLKSNNWWSIRMKIECKSKIGFKK